MKRLNDDEIILTQAEINDIQYFIRESLYRDWDHHTNNFICSDSTEDGMKRMNPEMYDLASKLSII